MLPINIQWRCDAIDPVGTQTESSRKDDVDFRSLIGVRLDIVMVMFVMESQSFSL